MPLTRLVIDYKDSVKAATTGAVTLTGGAPNTVDGVSLALNDRVLVKNQSNAAQNGIYRVSVVGTGSNGTWVRANDFDDWRKITPGSMVFIDSGSTNGNVFYFIRGGLGNVVIDSTAINFSNLSATFASGITIGGGNTQVQFNDAGNFNAIASFNVNKTTGRVEADTFRATNNGGGTNFFIGDDTVLGDINVANTVRLSGQQDGTQAYLVFGNSNASNYIGRSGTNPITVTGNFTITGTTASANFTNTGTANINTMTAATIAAGTIGNSGATITGAAITGTGNITGAGFISTPTGGEGGEISFRNPDNVTTGLFIDVQTANVGRVFQTSTNSSLQIGQLSGTGGAVGIFTEGTERIRINSVGNVGIGNSAPMADLQTGPGSATIAPFMITGGTNLTVAQPGAVEHDGINFYTTSNTTNGRSVIPTEHRFTLQGTGAAISTTANFFGSSSNIPLVANGIYDIDIYLNFSKATSATCNVRLTNSASPTGMDVEWEQTPITGAVNPPGTATMLYGRHFANTAANWWVTTGSLTTGVNHSIKMKVFLINGSGTSLKIEANATSGTLTPLVTSRWVARRIQANVGATAA